MRHNPATALPEQRAMTEFVRQVFTFALVGAAAAAGHYGTLVLLVELFGVGAVAASLAGFVVGGLISYPLSRSLVFRSRRAHGAAAPSFVAIAAVAFVLDGVLMALLLDRFGLHYLLAQILATLVLLTWTFTANRLWTFREAARGVS